MPPSRTREKTYLPDDQDAQATRELFARLEAGLSQSGTTRLVSPSGEELELPPTLFEVLRFVGATLANGQGVTVVPRDAMLTTQAAADFLGVSRPTLVKLLETDKIPFTKVGRHRRVTLGDVLAYQDKERARRRTVLTQAARNNQESGMLELTTMDPDA
jgi:excisionase family DNA binding protein